MVLRLADMLFGMLAAGKSHRCLEDVQETVEDSECCREACLQNYQLLRKGALFVAAVVAVLGSRHELGQPMIKLGQQKWAVLEPDTQMLGQVTENSSLSDNGRGGSRVFGELLHLLRLFWPHIWQLLQHIR